MGSIIARIKRIRRWRRVTQASVLALLNLQFLNIWLPSLQLAGLRGACCPVFYCHSCPWATMACPLGVLVNFSRLGMIPFITLGILGLVAALGGRLLCGWACPFGLLQDMLHRVPTRKLLIPHCMTYTKYFVLVIFVLALPFFRPGVHYTFCDGCPASVLESTIPWAFAAHWHVTPGMFNGFTTRFYVRAAILLFTLILSILSSRGFCRVFCPLGAMFGLLNKFSLFRFSLGLAKCEQCGGCAKRCPVDIDPMSQMNNSECIRCYECTHEHIKMGTT